MDITQQQLEEHVQAQPKSTLFPYLAERLLHNGRIGQAGRISRAGVEANPEYVTGRIIAGQVALEREEYAFARDCLLGALENDPGALQARELLLEHREALDLSPAQQQEIARILRMFVPDHALAEAVLSAKVQPEEAPESSQGGAEAQEIPAGEIRIEEEEGRIALDDDAEETVEDETEPGAVPSAESSEETVGEMFRDALADEEEFSPPEFEGDQEEFPAEEVEELFVPETEAEEAETSGGEPEDHPSEEDEKAPGGTEPASPEEIQDQPSGEPEEPAEGKDPFLKSFVGEDRGEKSAEDEGESSGDITAEESGTRSVTPSDFLQDEEASDEAREEAGFSDVSESEETEQETGPSDPDSPEAEETGKEIPEDQDVYLKSIRKSRPEAADMDETDTDEPPEGGMRDSRRQIPFTHPFFDPGEDDLEEKGGAESIRLPADLSEEEINEILRNEILLEAEAESGDSGQETAEPEEEDSEREQAEADTRQEFAPPVRSEEKEAEILRDLEEPGLQITERMATFTFASVLKSQGLYEQAYQVLEILRKKSGDIRRIEREQAELKRLIDRQNE